MALGLAVLGAVVAAAAFGANFTVYSNGFHSAADVREVSKVSGGKRCTRRLAGRGNRLRMTTSRGPATCVFRPPVESDRGRPDHIFRVDGTILAGGRPKVARNTAFLLLRIRAGGGTHYELRILPKGGRYQLRRRPDSGAFPVTGTSNAIRRIGRLNRVRLLTIGDEVRATVNGTQVVAMTDPNPGAVTGRRMHFGFGHRHQTTRNFFATLHRTSVSVPTP